VAAHFGIKLFLFLYLTIQRCDLFFQALYLIISINNRIKITLIFCVALIFLFFQGTTTSGLWAMPRERLYVAHNFFIFKDS